MEELHFLTSVLTQICDEYRLFWQETLSKHTLNTFLLDSCIFFFTNRLELSSTSFNQSQKTLKTEHFKTKDSQCPFTIKSQLNTASELI